MFSRVNLEYVTSFDLEYMFLRIRAASVGEIVEMTVKCLDDNETEVKYNLNINDVEVQFPEGHEKKIMLSEDTGLIMKYPGFEQFVDSSITGGELSTEEIFSIIADSIDQIFQGEEVFDSSTTTKKEFREFLD